MSATIKDIAKAVGVNPSTVSRVINGTASLCRNDKFVIRDTILFYPN